LVSCYAHVFVLFVVVIVTLLILADRPELKLKLSARRKPHCSVVGEAKCRLGAEFGVGDLRFDGQVPGDVTTLDRRSFSVWRFGSAGRQLKSPEYDLSRSRAPTDAMQLLSDAKKCRCCCGLRRRSVVGEKISRGNSQSFISFAF